MSVIGKIGELMVNYQYQIEALLLVVLVAIIIWLIYRGTKKSKEHNNLLEEINSKVDSINGRIDNLEGGEAPVETKSAESTGAGDQPESKVEAAEVQPDKDTLLEIETAEEDATAIGTPEDEVPESGASDVDPEDLAQESGASDLDSEGLALKYAAEYARDRLSGTDKFGKTYTEEMLKEQIKL